MAKWPRKKTLQLRTTVTSVPGAPRFWPRQLKEKEREREEKGRNLGHSYFWKKTSVVTLTVTFLSGSPANAHTYTTERNSTRWIPLLWHQLFRFHSPLLHKVCSWLNFNLLRYEICWVGVNKEAFWKQSSCRAQLCWDSQLYNLKGRNWNANSTTFLYL